MISASIFGRNSQFPVITVHDLKVVLPLIRGILPKGRQINSRLLSPLFAHICFYHHSVFAKRNASCVTLFALLSECFLSDHTQALCFWSYRKWRLRAIHLRLRATLNISLRPSPRSAARRRNKKKKMPRAVFPKCVHSQN
jgi:hypothetical protein